MLLWQLHTDMTSCVGLAESALVREDAGSYHDLVFLDML